MTAALMYHEIERPGIPLVSGAPGYVRYVVGENDFAGQMAWLADAGFEGIGIGAALGAGFDRPRQVAITFDDGCESDWTIAAPRLLERGFGATFYVVSRWIGERGHLSAPQLRALADAGFEVGSHSASHAFLSELSDEALRRELVESKGEIEAAIGQAVRHLSCPGGRTSRRVADMAREAGYESMATSRPGMNAGSTDRFGLARCAILRTTSQPAFEAVCRGAGLGRLIARERALRAAKALLGTRIYASLRNAALNRSS